MVPQGSVNSTSQGLVMYVTGKMYRTLAINWIPPCRICNTVKLGIKPYPSRSIFNGQSDHAFCCLPGRSAGCAADYPNRCYFPVSYLDLKLRSSETLAILAETSLPRKSASGRGFHYPLIVNFFS